MSTVNKKSVREEFEKMKNKFEQLSRDKKLSFEAKVLIEGLFTIINLLFSIFLEKTTKKDNKNSSKPSSQTEKDESSPSNQKTNGKGKNERHLTANHTRTVENVTIAQANQCNICGEDLTKDKCQHYERRTM